MEAREAALAEIERLLDSGDDPTARALQRVIERTAPSDPEAAEIIRAGAIPRRLSPTLVGVLRDRPDDHERNRALLEVISGLPMVHRRSDGSPAFHFDARNALLDWWRDAPGRLDAFRTYNLRLAAHWEGLADAVDGAMGDLARVEELLRTAAPSRLAALRQRLEGLETEPLLESLYHRVLADPQEASRWLFLRYEALETEARPGVALALLEAAEDELAGPLATTDAGELRLWLEYYRARHRMTLRRHREAREALESLRSRARDPRLRSWILGGLSLALRQLDDLAGAEDTVREQLEILRTTGADDFNLPGALGQLAGVLRSRGRLEEAEGCYREMAAAAREGRRSPVARSAHLQRAALVRELARGDDARRIAATVVDELLSRPEADAGGGAEREEMRVTLESFLPLVALDAPLVDALAAEAGALIPPGAEDLRVHLALRRLQAMRTSGRLEAALAEVRRLIADPSTPRSWTEDLALEEALLLYDLGDLDQGVAANTRLAEGAVGGTTWASAAARTNRGLKYRARGLWDAALEDFRRAGRDWETIGHSRYQALNRAFEAGTLERRDRVTALEAYLASGAPTGRERDRVEGVLLLLQGRWDEADARFRKGLEGDGGDDAAGAGHAVHLWLGRALLALLRGHWARTAEFVTRADEAWAGIPAGGREGEGQLLPPQEFRNPEVLDRVRDLLEAIAPELDGGFPERLADLRSLEGEHLLARGDAAGAAVKLDEAAEIQARMESPRASLVAGLELLTALASRDATGSGEGPGWAPARDRVLEAAGALAAAAGWSPDTHEGAALKSLASGVRALHRPGTEVDRRRARARELFREARGGEGTASHRSRLQLAYLQLREGRRKAAVRSFGELLAGGCRPWEEGIVRARLVRTLLAGASDPEVPASERAELLGEALAALPEVEAACASLTPEIPASAWLGVVDARILAGDAAAAREALNRVATSPVAAQDLLASVVALRTGLLGALDGDGRVAGESMREALTAASADPSALLAEVERLTRAAPLARGILRYRLEGIARDRSLPAGAAEAARAGLLHLGPPSDGGGSDSPLEVPPITVTIPAEAVRARGGIADDDPLLVRELPKLRDRLREEFALRIPRILLGEGGEGGGLRVLLRNRVAGTREGGVDDVVPFLEWVLRGHLADFVDLEEADDILVRWAGSGPGTEDRRRRRSALLADPRAMIRFTAVLRTLLAEEVPAGELDVVLQVLDHRPGEGALDAAEAVRKALAFRIPGVRPGRRLHLLHPAMERAIPAMVRGEGVDRHLAMDPGWGQEMMAALKEVPEEEAETLTVVVGDPALRPWVRQVVAAELPRAAVVASDELPEGVDPAGLPQIPTESAEGAW